MKTKRSISKVPSLLNNLSILLLLVMSLVLTSCSTEEVDPITIDRQE